MMKRYLLTLLLAFITYSVSAQYFNSVSRNYWKRYRKEVSVQLGSSHFLGELGGRDQIGSDFLWDLETRMTQPCGALGFRYYIGRAMALNAAASVGMVSGNDKLTDERFRRNRNLHFRSLIVEASLKYELHLTLNKLGNLYGIGSKSARFKNAYKDLYGFVGIGGFYFNPKAQYEGEWVELQPLGTEGQGLEEGTELYSRLQPVIPMGIGFRLGLGRKYRVGLELGYRKTFTDYIDDVSTDYYDNDKLRAERGDMAADLADPSLDMIKTNEKGHPIDPTATGAQRGDPTDNDSYIFLNITFSWKLGMNTRYMKRFNRSTFRRRTRAKF